MEEEEQKSILPAKTTQDEKSIACMRRFPFFLFIKCDKDKSDLKQDRGTQ